MSNIPAMNSQVYREAKMRELEKQMEDTLVGNSYSTESHFRRIGLPILSGLLDDSFNEKAWMEYTGSAHVALDIYSEDDNPRILFTLPPMLYIGPSLIIQPDEPSLTAETSQLMLQAGGANMLSDEAVGQLIVQTMDGIDSVTYGENVKRAKTTIDTANNIFEYYGVQGRIPYPEGLEAAYAAVTGVATDNAPQTAAAPAPVEATHYDFSAGEDL